MPPDIDIVAQLEELALTQPAGFVWSRDRAVTLSPPAPDRQCILAGIPALFAADPGTLDALRCRYRIVGLVRRRTLQASRTASQECFREGFPGCFSDGLPEGFPRWPSGEAFRKARRRASQGASRRIGTGVQERPPPRPFWFKCTVCAWRTSATQKEKVLH
jgi:hypothetical protein